MFEIIETTTILLGWIRMSQRILACLVSIPFGGVVYFDPGTSSPYLAQMFLNTMLATWLWRSKCVLPACISHPAVICCTVSGIFLQSAPWVLSGVVDSLYLSCVHDIRYRTVKKSEKSGAFSNHRYGPLISATFSIRRWYVPCRGSPLHDELSSFYSSSLGFCCLTHSLSRSSLGNTSFLMYSWIFVVSYWIVGLMPTNPQPQDAWLEMKCSICDVELPCLDIFGFYLFLWPGYYTNWISDDGQGIFVDVLDLVLTIQLTSQDLF